MSDAVQIQFIGGGLELLALLFGIERIDPRHQVALPAQLRDKILRITGQVLAAKENMLRVDAPMPASGGQFLQELFHPLGGIGNMERPLEQVAQAIAEEHRVRLLGKVHRRAEHLAQITGQFKKLEQGGIGISIDRIHVLVFVLFDS